VTVTEAVVVCNGVTYRGDGAARTITPDDDTSTLARMLLDTGDPVGPQIDEWTGLRGTWDQYPLSMVGAFLTMAAEAPGEFKVTWTSDQGEEPSPPPDPGV
jgi:hypothetical protein